MTSYYGSGRDKRSDTDDRVVVIPLTEEGKALQDKAKDVPGKVAGCIDLPPGKVQQLFFLLYELLDSQYDRKDQ